MIAIPYWYNAVPSYDVNPDIINARVLPVPYLTTNETRPPYSIPLTYVRDVLFGQTARFMVQGIVSDVSLQQRSQQQIVLIATFGTSNPVLIYLIMGLAVLICFVAIASFNVAGQPPDMDAIRLISFSKSAELVEVLKGDPVLLDNTIAYLRASNKLVTGSENDIDTVKIG